MEQKQIKYSILTFIFLVCLICSIIIVVNSYEEFCDTSCEDNDYEETFGIDNGWYGIVIFITFIILSIMQMKKKPKGIKILKTGIGFGILIASYFLYLQKYVLEQYCTYCLIIDFSLIICFLIIGFWRDKE